jgi:2-methylcitrate dehydratase PrpD
MAARPIDALVDHAVGTRIADLPDSARRAARDLLLDNLGVGAAGRTTAESVMALTAAQAWGSGNDATVWAGGPALPAGSAAFVNAHQAHTLEWDAIHEPAVVHPLTVVVPTVLAFAEREQSAGRTFTGAQLLTAVVVGVDVAAGLGRASTSAIKFFRPSVCGAMGAVAALCSLDGTAPDVARSAFGVVYGALSGTMQPHTEGAQVLALQCGLNARAALHAHDLARAGFVGPVHVLDGRYGWFTLIEDGGDVDGFVASLGQRWEVESTSVKPFPSGRATHGGLDLVRTVQSEHGFSVNDVERITITVPSLVFDLVGRPPSVGMGVGAARLCLPYLVPNMLIDGTVDLATYTPERLSDPALFAHAARVNVLRSDNPDPNAFNPQWIEVVLTDGRTLTARTDAVLGSPERPLGAEGLRDKFDRAMAAAGRNDQAPAIAALVAELDARDDIAPLLELL